MRFFEYTPILEPLEHCILRIAHAGFTSTFALQRGMFLQTVRSVSDAMEVVSQPFDRGCRM